MSGRRLLEPDFGDRPSQRAVGLLLAALLLWSLALRVWFATPELGPERFWDERYPLQNMERILRHGELRPVHGLHPAFSHLPHTALLAASQGLYRASGVEAFAVLAPEEGFTATAYLLCRLLQTLFAVASLALLFLVGRRLGGPRLGLLAAFLLAVVPWHLRQSVVFKADMVLMATLMLAFYLALRAAAHPALRRYAAAGGAIGLALASKYNAGPIAVPLTVAALSDRRRWRRNLPLLALAAVASVAVFLALNPFAALEPEIYRRSMGRTLRVYARKGHHAGVDSPLDGLARAGRSLLEGSLHGPVIGVVALTGLALVTILALRLLRRSPVALPWLMASSFVVSYTALYVFTTPNPSEHNYLPLSPFLALAAGWLLIAGWGLLSRRVPEPVRRPLAALAVLVLVLPLAASASRYTYARTVPETGELVLLHLKGSLGRPPGRLVIAEHDFHVDFDDRHLVGKLALRQVRSLEDVRPVDLDRADAVVFPLARLEDPRQGPLYHQRVERVPVHRVAVFEPRPFRARGAALVAILHPRLPVGPPLAGTLRRSPHDARLYVGDLPALPAAPDLVTLEFWLPRRTFAVELTVDGLDLPAVYYRGPRYRRPHITARFDWAPRARLWLDKTVDQDEIAISLQRWNEHDPEE